MKIETITDHELAKIANDWAKEIEKTQNEFHSNDDPSNYDTAICTTLIFLFRTFINELKQLNEEPVKRSELIDFFDYVMKRYASVVSYNRESVVDSYLKSINAAKRN